MQVVNALSEIPRSLIMPSYLHIVTHVELHKSLNHSAIIYYCEQHDKQGKYQYQIKQLGTTN